MNSRPNSHLLYAWYGDDFTGSTDVLEALGLHGIDAVLFTHTPQPRDIAAFPNCRAIGIAGESRSRTPAWMNRNLPRIFRTLCRLNVPLSHYKVCSTFDSSPKFGSIGRAIELGRGIFGRRAVPVVVGAPYLGRAVVFGNLFAEANGTTFRIDRHPTMRHHPVTPMTEADLRLHLAKQTSSRSSLVDLTAFQSHSAESRFLAEENAGAELVVFDGFSGAMLKETARIIWKRTADRPVFAVGSSGLTHGLLQYWESTNLIRASRPPAKAKPVDRLLVLSGSCSPVTAVQIRRAKQMGFAAWRLSGAAPWARQVAQSHHALTNGQSVVLYTALGPQPKNEKYNENFAASMGTMLRNLVLTTGVRRILIAGGDTSTHAVKQLKIDALTFAASLAPGVPLCRIHAVGSPLHGLELALKGGQMGSENFFAQVRDPG